MKSFILILTMLMSALASASFSQNGLRYISGPEILTSLYNVGIRPIQNGNSCQFFREDNQVALGINSPSSGRAASSDPSVATIDFISSCVALYFSNDDFANKIRVENEVLEWLGPYFKKVSEPQKILNQKWKNFPLDSKKAVVAHLVKKILGPDELIQDYGLISSVESFRTTLQNIIPIKEDETVKEAIKQLTLILVLRDEFLSY